LGPAQFPGCDSGHFNPRVMKGAKISRVRGEKIPGGIWRDTPFSVGKTSGPREYPAGVDTNITGPWNNLGGGTKLTRYQRAVAASWSITAAGGPRVGAPLNTYSWGGRGIISSTTAGVKNSGGRKRTPIGGPKLWGFFIAAVVFIPLPRKTDRHQACTTHRTNHASSYKRTHEHGQATTKP